MLSLLKTAKISTSIGCSASFTSLPSLSGRSSQTGYAWAPSASKTDATACVLGSNLAGLFLCALDRARVLDMYHLLSFRIVDSFCSSVALFTAAFAALLARRSRRRLLEFEARRDGRHTSFQVASVGWSDQRKASGFFAGVPAFC